MLIQGEGTAQTPVETRPISRVTNRYSSIQSSTKCPKKTIGCNGLFAAWAGINTRLESVRTQQSLQQDQLFISLYPPPMAPFQDSIVVRLCDVRIFMSMTPISTHPSSLSGTTYPGSSQPLKFSMSKA